MPQVLIYTTGFCPYCVAAKNLLKAKGVEWEEVRVDKERSKREEMMERSQRRTVPQIYIGEHHVGGYDDMVVLDQTGELDELLAA